jgi:demethylmenaquinone methyltransferase/2-methoxy-6-polyprenyl-1,4-benzoquinol methylase
VRSLFNRIAPVYDTFNDELSLGWHRVWKQMTVAWSGAKPGDRALDVCCGSGDLTQRLAIAVRGTGRSARGHATGHVTGLDFSADLLAVARARSHSSALPITWVEGDALALPFADNTFDCATMGYGLRNIGNVAIAQIDQALAELLRVLKPSSTVAILDMHRPASPVIRHFQQWYLQTWVVPAAERAGMKDDYAYIAPSLDRFPTGAEQVNHARQVGFAQAVHYPLAGGMMGVLVATKAPVAAS